ncbi:hypothetical protein C8Q80DRAFT_718077 [Daedaleopsis nitida]|nr:hypothetical protein C8Q80DRAFT_718077 [Daedaleopsis nitida]
MSWSLLSSSPASGKTYARPLGLNETSFYYDRVFNGTADIVWRYLVQLTDSTRSADFFNEDNVRRTWMAIKRWYPILAARVDVSDGLDRARFVVSEHAVTHFHPDDVTFTPVSSRAEVEDVLWSLLCYNPMADHHLISRVIIFPHLQSPGTFEIFFRCSHCMADGLSGATLARDFFDILVSPPIPTPPLEERLAMALASDHLNPTNKMSIPRQRWRRAIAQVTFLNRRRRLAGGHTLPRTITDKTYRTPGTTDRIGRQFSLAETVAILDWCKRQKLTFGAAIPVISQLALTRILHRRYLRRDMSEDEWEYRRRQPMHFAGAINVRPYVDAEWQRKGGATEIALMIDLYECTLPFMPTPYGTRRDEGVPRVDGAPPYSALMSHARFFHRTRLFKAQLQRHVTHPLRMDIASARQPSNILGKKRNALHWLAEKNGDPLPELDQPPHWDSLPADFVNSNNHSSVGQLSLLIPERYPLPPGHPLSLRTPRAATATEGVVAKATSAAPPMVSEGDTLLRITDSQTYLHARPTLLLLGNGTERDQIGMMATFDANVYAKSDVEEFIDECREVALHYLASDEAPKARL